MPITRWCGGTQHPLRQHPFLLFGLLTFAIFLTGEAMSDAAIATPAGQVLAGALQVLVAPLWMMRNLEMLLGMGSWPVPLQLIVALPLLFLPYVLADYALRRLRITQRAPSSTAAH